MTKRLTLPLFIVLVAGCAQVPKQSVELSATVGRDLATIHIAHRELAQTLFDRMRQDVNRFINDVYTPYQVNMVIQRQAELARDTNPEIRRKSLFLRISSSLSASPSAEQQANLIRGMSLLLKLTIDDIASFRSDLLDTLNLQEREVVASIDRAYQQVHYANSIVTGHLASVVQVHDKQAELLEAVGVDRDLRRQIGNNLARTSNQIGGLVSAAENADAGLKSVEANARRLKGIIGELGEKLGIEKAKR
jgi:hypothetical protein